MEYNKILMEDFLNGSLHVHIDTKEHHYQWANAIKEFNIRWCSGTRIEDEYISENKMVSIRRSNGKLQFSNYNYGTRNMHDSLFWNEFLDLLHTNKNPRLYYW